MIQYLNPKNLLLLRSYLPEILFILLTSAVCKLYIEMREMEAENSKFKTEVNQQVLIKLIESTNAINQNNQALQRISEVLEKQTD